MNLAKILYAMNTLLKLKNCRKGEEKYNNNNNKWESV